MHIIDNDKRGENIRVCVTTVWVWSNAQFFSLHQSKTNRVCSLLNEDFPIPQFHPNVITPNFSYHFPKTKLIIIWPYMVESIRLFFGPLLLRY
jgi:hypothetical protein